MPLRAPIDAVIFDLDGVLLDTEPLYTQATQEVVGAFEKTYEWSLKRRVMGRGQLEAAELVTNELALPITPAEYVLRVEAILERLFGATPAMPGAEGLVESLLRSRAGLAIATSTEQRLYSLKVLAHPWLSRVGVVVCGDDPGVLSPKPAPDIFLVAARKLGVERERCVVIEDSPNGVLAAKRAGMQVIALPDARLDVALLEGAEVIVRDHTAVADALRAVAVLPS